MDTNNFFNEFQRKITNIQKMILDFLQSNENKEEDFQNLIKYLDELLIRENKHELKIFLHLISKISNDFHRSPVFVSKIEQILRFYQNDMKKHFSNYEIFRIFSKNKRIILFFFKEKIVIPDMSIFTYIIKEKYISKSFLQYFYFEFLPFFEKSFQEQFELTYPEIKSDSYEKKREIGENDNEICQLIRDDSIDEFVIYVNKTNFPLSCQIKPSIFETNSFLLKKQESTTLIEYAAFFGSIQIFQYLKMNKIELKPLLWLYAIHSNNDELIHILEENKVKLPNDFYKESIKCHHIKISNYIKNEIVRNIDQNEFSYNLHFYNFLNLNENDFSMENHKSLRDFYDFCRFDYIDIVDVLLKNCKYDLNDIMILTLKKFINEISNYFIVIQFQVCLFE